MKGNFLLTQIISQIINPKILQNYEVYLLKHCNDGIEMEF